MATQFKSVREISKLGKRIVNPITIVNSRNPTRTSPWLSSASVIRGAYTTVYDKNLDDNVFQATVPDDVIDYHSNKYWAPHPKTGVFGPETEQTTTSSDNHGLSYTTKFHGEGSVLDETVWFRPTSLEDLEKPHYN